jgi:hypothetical protein
MKAHYLLDGLYDPTKGENYRKGTIGHDLLENIYKDPKANWMKNLESLYEKNLAEVQDAEKINSIFGIFEALITCYLGFYKKDFSLKINYLPEQVFDIDYKGYRLRGKTDLCFTSGKVSVIMEHKFWSQISEDKLAYVLSMDFQSNFYSLVYRLMNGKYPNRIDYNVVRVPQNKIKDGESSRQFAVRLIDIINKDPKYYFRRVPVTPSQRQQFEFEASLKYTLDSFKKMIESGYTSMNYTSCYPGIFLCDYAQICVSGTKAGYKTKPLFSELK